ncbi:HNH endonuclease signature motif containing protein [Mycolicibacterium sp. 050158]|uniref:HNH endonuclease signature motif containing protein n=1 Tax=Mycolicibacterium sp. 050158 TaxID=3090602 RepID=UPI00299DE558|nr:DUF222 domain-containing protein [Mycolicibacterium sp. 050158]MDX1889839.1 DUF222 domain-containing protein [Mycolicibacterium sp. 050158]
MSTAATSLAPQERLEVLFAEMEELAGQRNAIDGRLAQIAAEIDRDGIWGSTGARSVPALVAWKLGISPHNAVNLVTVARRLHEFPRLAAATVSGRLSLDQIGVIAAGAASGSDDHYAELAVVATVTQLRTAVKLEPQPEPGPSPEVERSFIRREGEAGTTWKITLPPAEAAVFDAAVQSHHDALIAQWRRDHGGDGDGDVDDAGGDDVRVPPFPDRVDAFLGLVQAGWDTDVAQRPHGQRTTVVVHLDVESRSAAWHLGGLLSDDERRMLLCDTTCEVWLQQNGRVIGAGRETRQISPRLRRALEHRDRCCVVPGCGATRGLHAHHVRHWEDGGPTELENLVLLCPYHHRLHHRGGITIAGTADDLVVTDADGTPLTNASLARPPTTPPPDVPPCRGPLGEKADRWWYDPYEPPDR